LGLKKEDFEDLKNSRMKKYLSWMKKFISSSNIICWTNRSGYGKILSR